MYTIYALIDPRDTSTRYVGMTGDIYTRLAQHIRGESGTPEKNAWIQELKSANLIVGMVNLEQVADVEHAREREVYWIFHFMALHAPLLNQHLPILEKHKQSVRRAVDVTVPVRPRLKNAAKRKGRANFDRKQFVLDCLAENARMPISEIQRRATRIGQSLSVGSISGYRKSSI